jgi:hypothetical protein
MCSKEAFTFKVLPFIGSIILIILFLFTPIYSITFEPNGLNVEFNVTNSAQEKDMTISIRNQGSTLSGVTISLNCPENGIKNEKDLFKYIRIIKLDLQSINESNNNINKALKLINHDESTNKSIEVINESLPSMLESAMLVDMINQSVNEINDDSILKLIKDVESNNEKANRNLSNASASVNELKFLQESSGLINQMSILQENKTLLSYKLNNITFNLDAINRTINRNIFVCFDDIGVLSRFETKFLLIKLKRIGNIPPGNYKANLEINRDGSINSLKESFPLNITVLNSNW